MPLIYEPRGKAREYAALACNIYRGCSHSCAYCYAPSATFTDRAKFYGTPSVRADVLKRIQQEAEKIRTDSPVLLCFTCDPYQPMDIETKLTRKVLEIFRQNHIPAQVLTKGGMRATRDFDILSRDPRNLFSVTLTHDNPAISIQWEPGAAPPAERIESLRLAKAAGISTWASFEPVIDPQAVYRLIEATRDFVDLYKVGKMNYHPIAKTIDWHKFRITAEAILRSIGKDFYIKEDLRKF